MLGSGRWRGVARVGRGLRLALGLSAGLLVGCDGGEKESGSEAPPINQDDSGSADCSGTAPVINELTVAAGDPITTDGGTFPSLVVQAEIEDADRDLYTVSMDLWYDTVVDGAVDSSGDPLTASPYEVDEDPCETSLTSYGLQIGVDGTNFDYETAYEFLAVVYDAHGDASAPVVADGVTPGPL